jgi:hypothetical protein
MKTRNPSSAKLTKYLALLQREIKDYVKAKRGEMRKRPVYLAKDSDICVDRMREAFDIFVNETYRD